MKNFIFIMILSIFFISGCSQTSNVVNAHSYFQHVNFGTIAVDDKGKPITPGSVISRFVFLESKSNSILKVTKIIFNDSAYIHLSVSSIGEKEIMIGVKKADNSKIHLTPSKGNTLWRIEFTAPDNQVQDPKPSKVIIKGVMNKKPFNLKIENDIELKPFIGM